ncbi:hypothetical protein BDQ17DRAFT_1432338 [Cyathus striatus]|nr:hypothetical protein BDQ17DRAFT_1432338 [Cyathus striatus]
MLMNSNFTVLSRISTGPDLNAIRKRVNEVDPNEGRCLVENCSDSNEYCHALPERWIGSSRVELEHAKGRINLDTRYNTFPVGESIRRMFENHQCILVPDDTIVNTILRRTVPLTQARNRFSMTSTEGQKFEYRIIPITGMENVIFKRRSDMVSPLHPGASTEHKYPFDTLPKRVGHVHLKFVIAAVGSLLRTHNRNRPPSLAAAFSKYDDDPNYYPCIKNEAGDNGVSNTNVNDEKSSTITGYGEFSREAQILFHLKDHIAKAFPLKRQIVNLIGLMSAQTTKLK